MPLCKGQSCTKLQKKHRALYNIPGEVALYCRICMPMGVGMVDVYNKKCEKCIKRPTFGHLGESPRFCVAHKEDGMIDVKNRTCGKCNRQPTFGYPGERPLFCVVHKEDNMVDVVNKKCEKCMKIPIFGNFNETARFCVTHRENWMVDVVSKTCEKCTKHPKFGYDGEAPRFCMVHKESGMIDVKNKICPGYGSNECPVRTQVSRGNMYCMSCDQDERRHTRFKRLENAFFNYVIGKLEIHKREFRVNFDQKETAKTCARVDGVVIGDGIIVCIEVDENGHRDYECDEHRMHLVNGELHQKYLDHNIAWVRVNPTTSEKNQWSDKSRRIRERRFDEVIEKVDEILLNRDTALVYIGFD